MNLVAHLPTLRRYARCLTHNTADADDLVQDTLLRALEKQHLYVEGNLGGWLSQIMRTLYIDGKRSALRRRVLLIENPPPGDYQPPTQESALLLREIVRQGEHCTAETTALGYSDDEIGRRLGVPRGTVRSRRHKMRAKLRTLCAGPLRVP